MNTLILEDGTPQRRHRARLGDLLATTTGIVRIASAYVTDRELLSDIGGRDTRLLISLLPMDIASGAMSLETLRWMLESGVEIRVLPDRPRLHAKTYIFGMSVAVVTSANLTRSAFESNLEVGVEVRGEDLTKLARWFDQLWQIAFPLTAGHLIELQRKTAALRREFVKFKQQSQSELVVAEKQQTDERLTDSLQNLFETAPRFFVCNTNRRYSEQTATGGSAIEQEMYSRQLATAWETFKFPSHMQLVEPGDGVFMFAKGVGIIGIGVATAQCEILSATDPNRLWYKGEDNTLEWHVPTKWLAWKDDADACPYPGAPNFTFWNVTGIQYDDFRELVNSHFLGDP
jgi:hypothetical protein